MHQFGPTRIPRPQGGRAFRTEIALSLAGFAAAVLVFDLGAIDADRALALDLQRVEGAHDVDGVSPAARRLAADRAVAKLIRIRRVALQREAHRAAAA